MRIPAPVALAFLAPAAWAAPPELIPPPDLAVAPQNHAPASFTLVATDADPGDALTFELQDRDSGRLSPLTAFLTPRESSGDRHENAFRWTPTVHDYGVYPLRAVARDAAGNEDTADFTLTVQTPPADVTVTAFDGPAIVALDDASPAAHAYTIEAESAAGLPLEYALRIIQRGEGAPPQVILPFQDSPTFAVTFETAANYSLRPEVRTPLSSAPTGNRGLEVRVHDPGTGLVPSPERPTLTRVGPARFELTWPADPHDRVARYRVHPFLAAAPGPETWIEADGGGPYEVVYDFADPDRPELRAWIAEANAVYLGFPLRDLSAAVTAVPRDGNEPRGLFAGPARIDFVAALPHVEDLAVEALPDRTVRVTLGPVSDPGGDFVPAEVRLYWNDYAPGAGGFQSLPAVAGSHVLLAPSGTALLAGEARGTLLATVVDATTIPGAELETLVTPHEIALDPPRCFDGLDNDGDGLVDHDGPDRGCAGPDDDDEYDRIDGFGAGRRALIVYNVNTTDGEALAEYYRAARGLDPATLCPVHLPPGSHATAEELLGARREIVESCLCRNVLARSAAACAGVAPSSLAAGSPVTHLALMRGVPERLIGTGWPSDEEEPPLGYYLSWLVHHDGSIFGPGTTGQSEVHGYAGNAPDIVDHQPSDGIAGQPRPVSPALDRMLAYGHVTAYDTQRTRDLIDRTLAAEAQGFRGSLLNQGNAATFGFLGRLAGDGPDCAFHAADPEALWPHPTCRAGTTAGGLIPGEAARDGLAQRIPYAVHAGLYLGSGLVPGHHGFHGFDTLLAWRRVHPDDEATPCIPLCRDHPTAKARSACRNRSSDVFREIDTRCVGVADGFLGWQFRSWTVQGYGFQPPGFDLDGTGAREKTLPVPRQGSPFGDGYVHFGMPEAVDAPSCLDDAGRPLACPERIYVSLTAGTQFDPPQSRPETAVALQYRRGGGSTGRLRIGIDYHRDDGAVFPTEATIALADARPDWTEATVVLPAPAAASPVVAATLRLASRRDDELRGWLDLDDLRWYLTADPGRANLLPDDAASFERPYLGPTRAGDWAAHALDRLGGVAWWGSSSHHVTGGQAFVEVERFAGAFFGGRTLGEALLYTGRGARSGLIYGDPLYRPSGARVYLDDGTLDADGRYAIIGDGAPSPEGEPRLYVDAFHGQANLDTTEWTLEACRQATPEACGPDDWVAVDGSDRAGVNAVLGQLVAVESTSLFDASRLDEDQAVTLRLRVFDPADEIDVGAGATHRHDLIAHATLHYDAVANHAPRARDVRIEPLRPGPGQRLFAFYVYDDAEGQLEDLAGREIVWRADGVAQADLSGAMTVPPGRTTEGQVWHAEVRVSDGQAVGPPVASAPLVVGCGTLVPVTVSGAERTADGGVRWTVEDPNRPERVTGYALEAGTDPAALVRVGDPVADAAPGSPGIQIEAASVGPRSFYRVRAVDGRCPGR